MWKCQNCGNEFDEPGTMCDDPSPAGVGLPPGCYEYNVCPNCGCDDVVEMNQCEACGEWTMGELCEDCEKEIDKRLSELLQSVMALGLDEIEAKNQIYERMDNTW